MNAPTEITEFLTTRIDAGDFPSAVFLVGEHGSIRFHDAIGNAVVEPEIISATPETIYDLASLTKVLVTGFLTATAIEKRLLSLDDRIANFVDAFASAEKNALTIRNLAAHTSGMPAWRPLYLLCSSNEPAAVIDLIGKLPLESTPGSAVVYSDLNFITLAAVLEKVFSQSLAEIAAEHIFRPLGLTRTAFRPADKFERRLIAASEKGNAFERQTCIEQGYITETAMSPHLRTGQIWGEVHDGNACFLGGIAGHAGLFSTAADVFKIALQFLAASATLLSEETCRLFTANLTPHLDEHRSLAFQLASTPDSTAGTKLSLQSFGHLGFTGTSLWLDPSKQRIFILLTNRTHHHGLPLVNINSVRRRFHTFASEFADKGAANL
ncbi:MAG: serine hydrolase [Acidobacteria bacterium]|nr:serine hydrolase [Acidobacteriota bacterium]